MCYAVVSCWLSELNGDLHRLCQQSADAAAETGSHLTLSVMATSDDNNNQPISNQFETLQLRQRHI